MNNNRLDHEEILRLRQEVVSAREDLGQFLSDHSLTAHDMTEELGDEFREWNHRPKRLDAPKRNVSEHDMTYRNKTFKECAKD